MVADEQQKQALKDLINLGIEAKRRSDREKVAKDFVDKVYKFVALIVTSFILGLVFRWLWNGLPTVKLVELTWLQASAIVYLLRYFLSR